MNEFFISFDFGLVKVPDIKVSESDFCKILDKLGQEFDIYCCDNPVYSHYFLVDYCGNLQQIGYVRGCDCE